MTEKTVCPACGAPLQYSGDTDVVRCSFCGAQLKVVKEDGHEHIQVLSQPEPQKTVLSEPVKNLPKADQPAIPGAEEGGPAESGSQNEWTALDFNAPSGGSGEPVGNVRVFSTGNVGPTDYPSEAGGPDLPPPTMPFPPPPGPPQPPAGAPPAAGPSNRNLWIGIGVAALILVLITCACAAGSVLMLINVGSR